MTFVMFQGEKKVRVERGKKKGIDWLLYSHWGQEEGGKTSSTIRRG